MPKPPTISCKIRATFHTVTRGLSLFPSTGIFRDSPAVYHDGEWSKTTREFAWMFVAPIVYSFHGPRTGNTGSAKVLC